MIISINCCFKENFSQQNDTEYMVNTIKNLELKGNNFMLYKQKCRQETYRQRYPLVPRMEPPKDREERQ